jgi:hypothetical protein
VGGREKRKLTRDFVAGLPEAFGQFRKASSQDCRKSTLAGLNQLQRRKKPFRSHPYSFPDGIVDFTKKAVGAASIERRALGERSAARFLARASSTLGAHRQSLNSVVL